METLLFGVLPVLAFVGLATRSVVRGRRCAARPSPTGESEAVPTGEMWQAVVEDPDINARDGRDAPHRQGGR